MSIMPITKDKPQNEGSSETDEVDNSATLEEDNREEIIQEIMGHDLDMMLQIVMQIREDEDFARGIYANCPRLQHLLDQYPDLRPIFEEPRLIRLNFEDVYRKAGGILPEDTPTIKQRAAQIAARVVKHPLFRFLRFLLILKKIYKCASSGGVAYLRKCLSACCNEVTVEEIEGGTGTGDNIDKDLRNSSDYLDQDYLNRAADFMEGMSWHKLSFDT